MKKWLVGKVTNPEQVSKSMTVHHAGPENDLVKGPNPNVRFEANPEGQQASRSTPVPPPIVEKAI